MLAPGLMPEATTSGRSPNAPRHARYTAVAGGRSMASTGTSGSSGQLCSVTGIGSPRCSGPIDAPAPLRSDAGATTQHVVAGVVQRRGERDDARATRRRRRWSRARADGTVGVGHAAGRSGPADGPVGDASTHASARGAGRSARRRRRRRGRSASRCCPWRCGRRRAGPRAGASMLHELADHVAVAAQRRAARSHASTMRERAGRVVALGEVVTRSRPSMPMRAASGSRVSTHRVYGLASRRVMPGVGERVGDGRRLRVGRAARAGGCRRRSRRACRRRRGARRSRRSSSLTRRRSARRARDRAGT